MKRMIKNKLNVVLLLGSIAAICDYNAPFTLNVGTPVGGVYSGTGVSGGTFNPSTAGAGTHTITYKVTQSGCTGSATTQIVVNECLGVEDVVSNDLTIYPNPTSSIVYLKGTIDNYDVATLIDVQGRVIATWNLKETTQFDLSNFNNGSYFIKIIGKDNSVVTKIELMR